MAYVHTRVLILVCVSNYGLAVDYRPPRITYPNSSHNLYYQSGAYVQIGCTAEGNPPPTWLENDLDLRPSTEIRSNQTTGILEIYSFSLRQQTSYRCIATVPYGLVVNPNANVLVSAMSPKIRLWQLRLERFASQTDIIKNVTEYDYLVLPCGDRKTSVSPALKYVWYETESGASLSNAGGRLFVDQDGSLHFTYVLVGDGRYEGYSCGISTSLSDGFKLIRRGTKYVIHVSVPTIPREPARAKPQFKYSNTPVYVTKNSAATLECVFSGYGSAKHSWLDVNGIASYVSGSKYNISEDGRQMTVYNAQETDERLYYCAATHNGPALQASSAVFLNVTSPPFFVSSPPRDQVGLQNSNAQFICDARSVSGEVPPSPPAWFINSQRMQATYDTSKFQLSDDRKVLTVKNLRKPQDVMCVQCEVENTVGTVIGSACLHVILPIKILAQPQAAQEIEYGRLIDLTVTASTDPSMSLSYRWYFPTTSYNEGNIPKYMSFNSQSQVAFINTSKVSFDEYKLMGGMYNINVFHQHESRVVGTQVNLIDTSPVVTPGVPSNAEGNITVTPVVDDDSYGLLFWLLLLLLLILLAAVISAIIMCWHLRHKEKPAEEGKQEDKVVAPEPEETVSDQPNRFYATTHEEVVEEVSSDYSDEVGSQV